jgi:flavin-dependent dehydrogenase
MGRGIEVVLYEGKRFAEPHYNQCVGVLSPPIDLFLRDRLGVPFPRNLVQRMITGYTLHTRQSRIVLDGHSEPAYALRRVQFDNYLLEQAQLQGVQVVHSRVTDLEFNEDRVMIFSESDNREAAVVVGAFGLDAGTAMVLGRAVPYVAPKALSTIVTKVHPPAEVMENFGNQIHAFLPSIPEIEFGAVTPKGNHLSINIAGAEVDVEAMKRFLSWGRLRAVVPFLDPEGADGAGPLRYFKGRIPISIAHGYYGDRYVLVGDAAGLLRAFKGKGVDSACQTGLWAAEIILRHGVSRMVFAEHYERVCREILRDLPYGRAMRHFVGLGRRTGLLDRLVTIARDEPVLLNALFDAVSGNETYRAIVRDLFRPGLVSRALVGLVRDRRVSSKRALLS